MQQPENSRSNRSINSTSSKLSNSKNFHVNTKNIQATTNIFEARREPTHAHLVPPSTIPTVYLYLHAGDWTAEAVDGGGIAQSVPRTAGAGVRIDNLGALSLAQRTQCRTLPVHTKTASREATDTAVADLRPQL